MAIPTIGRSLHRTDQSKHEVPAISDRKVSRIVISEMQRRWTAVRAFMQMQGIDALIAQSRRDFHGGYVKWFTDVPAFNPRTVIFHRNDHMTVIDHGAANGRRVLRGDDGDHPGVGEILTTSAIPSAHFTQGQDGQAAASVIAARGYHTIGWVNAASIPYGFVQAVQSALQPSVSFVDATDEVDRLKAVKSALEIIELRKACALQDRIFVDLLPELRPGLREYEITALARYIGECHGSEQALYLASSAPQGEPANLKNRHWQGRTLNKGDYLNLLIENNAPGGCYAEFARTVVFGEASRPLVEAFNIALDAQVHTAKQLKSGASCAEIAANNDAFLENRGCVPEDRLYAHGQGYDLVERPLIRSDETMRLESGMYVSVHPAVRDSRIYMTVCDNFLIGKMSAERLHQTASTLFEIQ